MISLPHYFLTILIFLLIIVAITLGLYDWHQVVYFEGCEKIIQTDKVIIN